MKTWLAGWLAVSVMAIGIPALASGSSVVTAEGDLASTTYASADHKKVDSIIERIAKLKIEIGKGSSVYSPNELRVLELKFTDTQEQLSVLTHGG